MRGSKTIKLIIDSNLEEVFLVGLAVRAVCSHAPMNELAVYQVETGVVEAVNNVIKHAYKNRKGHDVEVIVSLFLDRITFQVCDTGTAMEPKKVSKMDFDPDNLEELPEGGMGLYVIDSVMDKVEYVRAGEKNILVMSKYFKKKH
jgi:serine/threonine-protein kinase RsbW